MNEKSPFDFEQLMKQFDPAEVTRQFQQMFASSPFSHLDPEKMMESQKKTVETIKEANMTALNGAQKLMKRQSEMMQQAMAEAAGAMKDLSEAEPGKVAEEQTAMVEGAVKKAMENFEEIAEMIEGIYTEVSGKVEQRMEQSVQELHDAIAKIHEQDKD